MRGLGVYRGFDKSRGHGWFISVRQLDGSRPKQYFPDQKARDKAFNAKVLEVRTGGVGAQEFTAAERNLFARMKRDAESTGMSMLDIFLRGLEGVQASVNVTGLTIAQAYESFLAEQKLRHAEGKISDPRLKEIRNVMKRFTEANGKKAVAGFSRQAVRLYLASLKDVGPQTRVNHARVVRFFFNWCIAEGMRQQNPVPDQEGVDRIPSVFTLGQVDELFDLCWKSHVELIPMLGCQWYAGLRPGLSQRLDWKDIDFDRQRILVHPHGNKLRQPDIVKDIPLTVFALLLPFRKTSGHIAPPNHVDRVKWLHRELGYGNKPPLKRWPEDVARHTFASHLYPLYELDEKRVQNVLLHSVGRTLRKHYLLKNIPLEQAEAYFGRHLPSA